MHVCIHVCTCVCVWCVTTEDSYQHMCAPLNFFLTHFYPIMHTRLSHVIIVESLEHIFMLGTAFKSSVLISAVSLYIFYLCMLTRSNHSALIKGGVLISGVVLYTSL